MVLENYRRNKVTRVGCMHRNMCESKRCYQCSLMEYEILGSLALHSELDR
jgi:hypothetical protein